MFSFGFLSGGVSVELYERSRHLREVSCVSGDIDEEKIIRMEGDGGSAQRRSAFPTTRHIKVASIQQQQ